jgi:glycosyltransferase involved in cell wall biosynthesis
MAIARRLRRGAYSRIHAHRPYGHQLGALAQVLTDLPLSISVHAHEVAHDSGHFAAVFELIDFAAFCNDAARRFLVERIPAGNAAKCQLIYHGVDLSAFPALPLPPTCEQLRLVSAGRLTTTKGFPRLLRAIATLRDRGVQVELSILGEGSQRQALTALATELGVRESVHFAGWLSPSGLRQVFEASDVFCLLPDTTYHDGLPNVVLEAQALGRPVVISSLPAAAEAVAHGVNGFVLEPEDHEGICDALARLARDPALRLGMSLAARARVEQQHDSRQHLAQLHQLLLNRSCASRSVAPRVAVVCP